MLNDNLKKKFKKIGVFGGMGAAASADFYRRLVEVAQKDYHAVADSDFPEMWIYNLPVRDFDETGFVNPESVKNQLIASVKKLQVAGSDLIVIPCNTAHYFYEDMQQATHVPILNILDITANVVLKSGYKKVGLLNSQSTRKYQLYETVLAKRGIVTISTNDQEQREVNVVIGNVIVGNQGKLDIDILRKIIGRYQQEGAQAIVLGCTELPLAITQDHCDLPLVSSTAILAGEALRFGSL